MRWLGWSIVILLGAGLPARAHQGEHPLSLRLLLKADGLHAALDFALDGEQARVWRARCDLDRDGRVDPAERAGCLQAQRARLLAGLTVRFDGQSIEARQAEPGPARLAEPVDSPEPVTASLQAFFPYAPGQETHTLELSARPELPGGHAPLYLQAGRGLELVAHVGLALERGGVRLIEWVLAPGQPFRAAYRRAPAGRGP
jgi:hypothetical protein